MSTSLEPQEDAESEPDMSCDFCEIIANRDTARVAYEDDDVVVIYNRLRWVPVMLLVIPTTHLSQEDMWRGGIMAKVAEVGVKMGETHCPGGFRLLSNFGSDAMQSQSHGHLHVLGGTYLGRYVVRMDSPS
jgi:histidine triad (HIT) family protein